MTKKNGTKRSLLMSAVALVLCFSMLFGSTFAWFTDSVTSSGNKIVAGNLDVDLYQWTSATASTEITNESAPIFGGANSLAAQNNNADTLWEPGKTQVAYLSIKNEGNLALKYKVSVNVVNPDGGKDLYKVMKYAIVPNATYGTVSAWTAGTAVVPGVNATTANDVSMNAGDEHFFALVIHMDETATNDYQNGAVEFDIKVEATQMTAESDSFGITYDQNAAYGDNVWPVRVNASEPVDGADNYVITLYDSINGDVVNANGKIAVVTVTDVALAAAATEIKVTIEETEDPAGLTIATDKASKTFDVKVEGINGQETVKVELFIGKDLTNVSLYHEGLPMDNGAYSYDPNSGWVTFHSATFSPFSVIYDEVAQPSEGEDERKPQASISQFTDEQLAVLNAELTDNNNENATWGSFGGWSPTNPEEQTMEAVYCYKPTTHTSDTVLNSIYKNWHADFHVSMDRDIPDGMIFLGGNYGSYGWIGFENNDLPVDAGTVIPLLTSVTNGETSGLTYEGVVDGVGTFYCGVARTYGTDMSILAGATFTVDLRLTNPENPSESFSAGVQTFTFPATNP